MTTSRAKDKEPEINLNSITSHMKLIDQAMTDIYVSILSALIGKSKVEDAKKNVSLFKYLWEKLVEPNLIFESVSELDAYYTNFLKNLDVYITDFFNLPKNEIKDKTLSDNKKKLFLGILKTYYALSKRKFLLSRIQFLDSKKAFDSISLVFSYGDLSQDKETISLMDALNEEIVDKLSASGYTKNKVSEKGIKKIDDELLTFISSLLSKLPSINQLSEIVMRFEEAYQSKDDDAITANKTVLNNYLMQIQETEKMINQRILGFQQNEENRLIELAEERDLVKNRIIEIERHDFFRTLRNLLLDKEIEHCQESFTELIHTCRQQSQQWIFNGPWEQTCKELENIVRNLEDNFNYLKIEHTTNTNRLICFLRALDARREQVDEVYTQLEEHLDRVRTTWQESEKSLLQIESILLTHLNQEEGLLTYCSSFLGRHWWKLLLGGATGGGVSCFSFLLSLNGTALAAFCVICTTLGFSLGATSGVLTDHCCPDTKQNREENPETVQLLLADGLNQEVIEMGDIVSSLPTKPNKNWWSSFSIWKGDKHEKPDEKCHNEINLTSYKPVGSIRGYSS